MDLLRAAALEDTHQQVSKGEVMSNSVSQSKEADMLLDYITALRREINDDESFYYFLEAFSDFTSFKIGWEEYQEDSKQLVPRHLYWLTNRMIRALLESLDVNPESWHPEELLHKIPKLSELSLDPTREVVTVKQDPNRFKMPPKARSMPAMKLNSHENLLKIETHNTPVAQTPEVPTASGRVHPFLETKPFEFSNPINDFANVYPAQMYALSGAPMFRPVTPPSQSQNLSSFSSPPSSNMGNRSLPDPRFSPVQNQLTQALEAFSLAERQITPADMMLTDHVPPPSPVESEAEDDDYEEEYEEPKKKVSTAKAILKKAAKKGKSRIRNEWTPEEDKIFLEGLLKFSADFSAIAKLLPNRSRYQIRTHYTYLAKNILANERVSVTGEAPMRRIKTRGRPPKTAEQSYIPSELLQKLTDCIRKIEHSGNKKVKQPDPKQEVKPTPSEITQWRHSI